MRTKIPGNIPDVKISHSWECNPPLLIISLEELYTKYNYIISNQSQSQVDSKSELTHEQKKINEIIAKVGRSNYLIIFIH